MYTCVCIYNTCIFIDRHIQIHMYVCICVHVLHLLPANLVYAGKEVIKGHHFVEVILQKTSENWCDEPLETTAEERGQAGGRVKGVRQNGGREGKQENTR